MTDKRLVVGICSVIISWYLLAELSSKKHGAASKAHVEVICITHLPYNISVLKFDLIVVGTGGISTQADLTAEAAWVAELNVAVCLEIAHGIVGIGDRRRLSKPPTDEIETVHAKVGKHTALAVLLLEKGC